MPKVDLREETTLPADGFAGALAARVWRPDVDGPSVVAIRENGVFDISAAFPTMRDLCETSSPAKALRAAEGLRLGALSDILAHTPRDSRGSNTPHLLAPIDLQAIKAAGVTFAESLLERVIEERARGSREGAAKARDEIVSVLGDDLSTLRPGSPAAMRLKDALVKTGAWSQYLEVGIGPDAEVFTKSQPMSSVGTGDDAGFHSGFPLEQPRTGGRSRGGLKRRNRRRDTRQRREFAGLRRAFGAPPRQSERSERELRDWALLAVFRRDVHARRRAEGHGFPRGRG